MINTRLMMHAYVWRAGWAVIAISLCTVQASAVGISQIVQFAQNVSGSGTTAPGKPAVADAPAAVPANSPEQIRMAQTELKRLDCLKGRIDGKLGDQTRQAVKKFWTSAKQPEAGVNITDELISDLAERGAGFCRPARKFFAMGFRPRANSTQPTLVRPFAPGNR
ncbi:MAG TPA: peptidoglycan-binding domain-containing protein [Xanthobacteraceae bacterium]|jgi:peptidoglycan hydrolase-like protein with peptidoglycan-binding domain|nr:peptidoglycan-binding domain-containing protein [Xanthobacteraceae bacterium]